MNKEKIQRIHRIYSILTGLVCILAGVCFIAGCLKIYHSGLEQPYSRQTVSDTFQRISIPVYLCTALVLGGFILNLLLPFSPGRSKPQKNHSFILSGLQRKADMNACSKDLRNQILNLQNKRKIHKYLLTFISVLCSIIFLIYALNINHFHQTEINESMIRAMHILLPCLSLSFGYGIFVSFYSASLIQKEIALYKQIPAAKGTSPAFNAKKTVQKPLQIILTFAAVTLIVYGLLTGGTLDVLTKAVNICTECIGLG